MQNKQIALIDIGSSKVSAVLAERGVNKTFIVKARKDFAYDGFSGGEFFDIEGFKTIIGSSAEYILKFAVSGLKTVYVGVPGCFTHVMVKDSQIAFTKRTKISEKDVDALFDSAFVTQSQMTTLINHSAIVYELDDLRMVANPLDFYSGMLKGKLSFITCDNYLINAVKPILTAFGFYTVEFVSTPLAEAMYLIDGETRDRIAIMVDVGYITTTVTLVQGDGILYQNSFDFGGGYITASITEKMAIDFDEAERLKRSVSLSHVHDTELDVVADSKGEYYNAEDIRKTIKSCLDTLCEKIESAREKSGYVIPDYVPIFVTGGGISYIRGAKAHLSNRLGSVVETIAPKVPLMEKPTESSVLSLLDLTF